jgi:hypothetical protein
MSMSTNNKKHKVQDNGKSVKQTENNIKYIIITTLQDLIIF